MSNRRACLILEPELLRDGLGPLFDHGLTVVRSIYSRLFVALEIAGDQLPFECGEGGPLRVVTVHITQEDYGRQRMARVSAISLSGQVLADAEELGGKVSADRGDNSFTRGS